MEIGIFMKISKIHQRFANRLGNQRALSHPEEFLGPNWKEVLNFWIYLDTLSEEKLRLSRSSYDNLNPEYCDPACLLARNAALNTVRVFIFNCAFLADPDSGSGNATLELIGAHKILEQGKSLKIVPLFLDS